MLPYFRERLTVVGCSLIAPSAGDKRNDLGLQTMLLLVLCPFDAEVFGAVRFVRGDELNGWDIWGQREVVLRRI